MLELKNLYKTFNAGTVNEKRAIDGLDLTLEDGDFVTIIGGNGAGKSTTLNLIAGVSPPTRAALFWTAWTSPACRSTNAPSISAASSRTP